MSLRYDILDCVPSEHLIGRKKMHRERHRPIGTFEKLHM